MSEKQNGSLPYRTTTALLVILVGINGIQAAVTASQRGIDDIWDVVKPMSDRVRRLDELHNRYDSSGTPLWYVPRDLSDGQAKLIDEVRRLGIAIDHLSQKVAQDGRTAR